MHIQLPLTQNEFTGLDIDTGCVYVCMYVGGQRDDENLIWKRAEGYEANDQTSNSKAVGWLVEKFL